MTFFLSRSTSLISKTHTRFLLLCTTFSSEQNVLKDHPNCGVWPDFLWMSVQYFLHVSVCKADVQFCLCPFPIVNILCLLLCQIPSLCACTHAWCVVPLRDGDSVLYF